MLPLRRAWWQSRPGWIGGRWPVRGEKVFLIPGDSPIGLRLPLDTLPTSSTAATNAFYTRRLIRRCLADRCRDLEQPKASSQDALRDEPTCDRDEHQQLVNEQTLDAADDDDLPTSDDVVHTALCVECRHGRLHVFMPPTQRLEDFLELIAGIEETCSALNLPVIIEGYLPPPDHRIELFKVTPDPGVIEVNTQPSESWDRLAELTETLYEAARQSRLGTDKFDLDGSHTGTGGGNHIVLGGKTPRTVRFCGVPICWAA